MAKNQSRKRAFAIVATIILVIVIAVIGLVYANYAQSESRETANDIPGAVISAVPDKTDAKPTEFVSPEPVQSSAQTPQPAQTTPAAPSATRNPTAIIEGFEGRQASGDVTIITTTEGTFIRLENNFDSSRAAPDNRVYLGDANGRQVEIAKLKAPSGGQNFKIPDGIDLRDYSYIWIHCKAYNTTYGSGKIVF